MKLDESKSLINLLDMFENDYDEHQEWHML